MRMSRLTPEGKVVFALLDGPARFGELKVTTSLSGAWLNRTLKQLYRKSIVKYDVVSKTYAVKGIEELQPQIHALMPFYLCEIASVIAEELAGDDRVQAVVLFGSVAEGVATLESDVDLLVVLKELNRKIEDEFNLRISELGFRFRVAIEPTLLGRGDFEATLAANVGIIFGLARGYEVLYDRTLGVLTRLLDESVARVKSEYSFIQEGELWMQKRELTAKV